VKKLVVIILLFVYSLETVGFTVHYHYCMNDLVGWDYTKKDNKKCVKCGMSESKTKKGCCKDEAKQLKLDTDHQKSTITHEFDFFQFVANVPNYFDYKDIFCKNSKIKNTIARPPPIYAKLDYNILYCVFRI
jgi:hypothetical protein